MIKNANAIVVFTEIILLLLSLAELQKFCDSQGRPPNCKNYHPRTLKDTEIIYFSEWASCFVKGSTNKYQTTSNFCEEDCMLEEACIGYEFIKKDQNCVLETDLEISYVSTKETKFYKRKLICPSLFYIFCIYNVFYR